MNAVIGFFTETLTFIGQFILGLIMAVAFMVLLTPAAIVGSLYAIWRAFGGPKPRSWTSPHV